MRLREYKSTDCAEIAQLFYGTVHAINAKDYTKEQLDVWAAGHIDIPAWDKSFLKHHTLIAEENSIIVGFGDMDDNGYLDRLYVHKDYQGRGIATAIVTKLEQQAAMHNIFIFTTYASITAKSFFEKHGYHVVSENKVIRNGVGLTNFIMEKHHANGVTPLF